MSARNRTRKRKPNSKPKPEAAPSQAAPPVPPSPGAGSFAGIHHKLLCGSLVLSNEDPGEFTQFRRLYHESFQPANLIEAELIDEMVSAKWRQRRAWGMETALTDLAIADECDRIAGQYKGIGEAHVTAAAVAESLKNSPALQQIRREDARLNRMYHRALKLLRELQAERKGPDAPVINPYLSQRLETPEDISRNEPPLPEFEPGEENTAEAAAPAAIVKLQNEPKLAALPAVLGAILHNEPNAAALETVLAAILPNEPNAAETPRVMHASQSDANS